MIVAWTTIVVLVLDKVVLIIVGVNVTAIDNVVRPLLRTLLVLLCIRLHLIVSGWISSGLRLSLRVNLILLLLLLVERHFGKLRNNRLAIYHHRMIVARWWRWRWRTDCSRSVSASNIGLISGNFLLSSRFATSR